MAIGNIPNSVGHYLLNLGWAKPNREVNYTNIPMNLDDARRFKRGKVGIPVIVNGGFQLRSQVVDALGIGGPKRIVIFVSMARPLLANPNLPRLFERRIEKPDNPCTFCNRCAVRTTLFPLGCYNRDRFSIDPTTGLAWSKEEADHAMQEQIERFNLPE